MLHALFSLLVDFYTHDTFFLHTVQNSRWAMHFYRLYADFSLPVIFVLNTWQKNGGCFKLFSSVRRYFSTWQFGYAYTAKKLDLASVFFWMQFSSGGVFILHTEQRHRILTSHFTLLPGFWVPFSLQYMQASWTLFSVSHWIFAPSVPRSMLSFPVQERCFN